MVKNSSFDLDFGYGRKGEQLVEELLTGGRTVEVKRDRKWWITNNLYIEVECWFNKSKAWEPSGFLLCPPVCSLPYHVLLCGGCLRPVLDTLRKAQSQSCHIPFPLGRLWCVDV